MNHRPGASSLPTSRALHGALASRGFEIDDFELEEAATSELAQLLGGGGVLKVHCHSTGEERLYATGAGSVWFGSFLMDLGKGHFADAARRPIPAHRPMLRHLPQPLSA